MCKAIPFSPTVQPVSLAHQNLPWELKDNFTHPTVVTVAGWGTLKEGGPTSKVLRAVRVQTLSMATCKKPYPWVREGQLCAGIFGRGGKDACQGDSGGPLWWSDGSNGKTYLVGVVSNGLGCARPDYPGNIILFTTFVLVYEMAKFIIKSFECCILNLCLPNLNFVVLSFLGVYTRVSHYFTWIQETMAASSTQLDNGSE
jgi:secreted trypsin-like serine protease